MQQKVAVKLSGNFTIYYAMGKPFAVVFTHYLSRSTVEPSFFIHSKPFSDTLYMTAVIAG